MRMQVRGWQITLISCLIVVVLGAGFSFSVFADGGAPTTTTSTSTTTSEPGAVLFIDVPADHWAMADLKYLAERGIITGLPDGKFKGDQALTRYSAAVLMARAVRFVQNNPDIITAKDIEVLKDLIFKISDRLQAMAEEFNAMKAQLGGPGPESELMIELQNRVQQNEQRVQELSRQLQQLQIQRNANLEAEVERLKRQANANFIIAIAGLFVGIIGIALATM